MKDPKWQKQNKSKEKLGIYSFYVYIKKQKDYLKKTTYNMNKNEQISMSEMIFKNPLVPERAGVCKLLI